MDCTETSLRFEMEKLESAAYMLKAVVHPTRIAIIDLLDQRDEMNVSDLAEQFGLSHALVSHHLNDMRGKGILQVRRDGRSVYYSIKEKAVLGLLNCVQNCSH